MDFYGDPQGSNLFGTEGSDRFFLAPAVNTVQSGGGRDTIYSTNGYDTIDAGADLDTWSADYHGFSAALQFTFDYAARVGAVAGIASATNIEHMAMVGGSGDDTFVVLRPAIDGTIGIDGGAGIDSITLDASGYSGTTIAGNSTIWSIGSGFAAELFFAWTPSSDSSITFPVHNLQNMETINYVASDANDVLTVDASSLSQPGRHLNLDGGAGNNTLYISFGAAEGITLIDGATTTPDQFRNWQTYVVTLGGGSNTVVTGAGNDTITGAQGADDLTGGAGNDTIDGGAGSDVVRFSGNRAGYQVTNNGNGSWLVTDIDPGNGDEGTDSLTRIELLQFADGTLPANGGSWTGSSANDTFIAPDDGAWTINGLGGLDNLVGAGGDDTFVISAQPVSGTILNGAGGFDRIEVHSLTAPVLRPDGTLSSDYALNAFTISNIEGVRFTGTANETQQLLLYSFWQGNQAGGVPTTIDGSSGHDQLSIVAVGGMGSASELVMPTISFNNWTSSTRTYTATEGDILWFYVADANSYTLRANEAIGTAGVIQALIGGGGNDTLIGSEGRDLLASLIGGTDTLHGAGGNDSLVAINQSATGGGSPTTNTFAGSLFDGGDGTDFLGIGGHVDFQGTLQSIEGLYLLPAQPVATPVSSYREAAQLTVSSSKIGGLPTNLQIDGAGNVIVKLDPGIGFNGSGFQFLAGSDVHFAINGTTGNDSITGTSGADVITTGGGVDTIHAGAGNDEIVIDAPIGNGSVFDGGADFDTLVLKTQPGMPYFNGGSTNLYNAYYPTAISNLEAVRFDSAPGDFLGVVVLENQRAFAGLTNLTGGGGRDAFYDVVFTPGTYMMPLLTFSNWSADVHDPNFDVATLWVSGGGNYVLNAREGLAAIQGLQGGSGNDTLIGSSGSDILNGGDGQNMLDGKAGDDLLFAENLTPYGGTATTLTYAGNVFNGGSGEDSLTVGGRVDFRGTLIDVEKIFFEVAYAPGGPGFNGLDSAYLILSGSNALALPGNAKINGNGTLQIDLGAVVTFSAANYQIGSGYTIELILNGGGTNDTITGSSTGDTINGGDGNDVLTGGAGDDRLAGGQGSDTAQYTGNRADYAIVALAPHQWQVTDLNSSDGNDGVDLLSDIELLQFADSAFTANLAPVAENLSVALDEDTSAEGQVAATDLEGDPLTFALVAGPVHGSLAFNPDGTFVYTPAPDYFGEDTFSFAASDGVNTSNVGSVTLTIAPVDNDPAVISGNLAGQMTESTNALAPNGTVSGQLTASDPDGPTTFVPTSIAGTWGSFQLAEDGAWVYELADDDPFIGALNVTDTVTDSFIVTTADGSSETVTITIQGANDAALIGGNTSGTVSESALAGGTSQVAGTLTISDIDNPAQFIATTINGAYGTLTLTTAGTWTYLLNNANATVDGLSTGQSMGENFTVRALDGTEQVISLTIAGSDDLRSGSNNADTLIGTNGNDTLNGNGGNDTLIGGLGNDLLNGGSGTDTASYAGLAAGVTVSLAISSAQDTGGGGIDTLNGIENLTGTAQADTLIGNTGANVLSGGDGNDWLDGGAGSDTLNGGNGTDTASYASAGSAVTVSLAITAAQNTGGSGSDTLVSIENLLGSAFNDILTGGNGINAINGGAGNDRIVGGGNADQLTGGLGNDTFAYQAVGDSSGSLHDLITDFQGAGSAGGDVIDLSAIDATPGGRDNAFVWGNTAATAHGIWYTYDAANNLTHLYADTDGNASTAELVIDIAGNMTFISSDFIF